MGNKLQNLPGIFIISFCNKIRTVRQSTFYVSNVTERAKL
jgi:hypothetical protein